MPHPKCNRPKYYAAASWPSTENFWINNRIKSQDGCRTDGTDPSTPTPFTYHFNIFCLGPYELNFKIYGKHTVDPPNGAAACVGRTLVVPMRGHTNPATVPAKIVC